LILLPLFLVAHTPPDEEDLYQEPIKRLIKPENQVQLTDEELKEEISRVLTGDDPNIPRVISKYNFKEKCYKPDPPGQSDHMAVHFELRGNSLHIDSDEYKRQKQREEKVANNIQSKKEMRDASQDTEEIEFLDRNGNATVSLPSNSKNRFNYSERSSQTFNNPSRNRGVSTEPPAVAQYSASVSQWDIYDSYIGAHLVDEMENVQDTSDRKTVAFEDKIAVVLDEDKNGKSDNSGKDMASALKIMERLVNQNAEDEIYQDFKYWEDASDQYRGGEGSLLPLWRFTTDRSKRKQVTALCWNPRYSDLFAVGYGSYEFMKQGSGLICCFSLKNTSFPEFIFSMESGVMCLDFHLQHPSLLAVGCYDGTVLVYNVSSGGTKPIYSSTIKTGKHTDPVWQIRWQKEDIGKELNFYSISSDGRVANWSMSKNELKMEPVMQLKLVNSMKIEPDDTSLSGLAGGCCFDFNEKQEHLFVVGTEEGNIHKCSKAYSGQYLETYEGHHMAVYAVKWNPFDDRIFITCSADWTVKVSRFDLVFIRATYNVSILLFDLWIIHNSFIFKALES